MTLETNANEFYYIAPDHGDVTAHVNRSEIAVEMDCGDIVIHVEEIFHSNKPNAYAKCGMPLTDAIRLRDWLNTTITELEHYHAERAARKV